PRRRRSGSHTPKKMPTAVKIPCHASVIGPKCTLGSNGIWINGVQSRRRGSCRRLGAVRSPHPPHLARRSLRSLRVVGARGTRGSRTTRSPVPPATPYAVSRCHFPWHFLNFFPDPHQHGSFLPGSLLGAVEEVGRPLPLVRVVVLAAPVCVVCVFSSCSACSAVLTVTRRMVWATPLAIRVSISSKKPCASRL